MHLALMLVVLCYSLLLYRSPELWHLEDMMQFYFWSLFHTYLCTDSILYFGHAHGKKFIFQGTWYKCPCNNDVCKWFECKKDLDKIINTVDTCNLSMEFSRLSWLSVEAHKPGWYMPLMKLMVQRCDLAHICNHWSASWDTWIWLDTADT